MITAKETGAVIASIAFQSPCEHASAGRAQDHAACRTNTTGCRAVPAVGAELTQLVIYEATTNLAVRGVRFESPWKLRPGRKSRRRSDWCRSCGPAWGWWTRLPTAPFATVYHIGIYRDEMTHLPVSYYNRLPERLSDQTLFMIDPMLATAGSASATAGFLKDRGATAILLSD